MAKALQQAQRLGMYSPFRLTAGAECLDAAVAQIIQDRFRHDGTRRISGAEEQNIVSHFAPAHFVAAIAMLEFAPKHLLENSRVTINIVAPSSGARSEHRDPARI